MRGILLLGLALVGDVLSEREFLREFLRELGAMVMVLLYRFKNIVDWNEFQCEQVKFLEMSGGRAYFVK
jgi:hypothetical protein